VATEDPEGPGAEIQPPAAQRPSSSPDGAERLAGELGHLRAAIRVLELELLARAAEAERQRARLAVVEAYSVQARAHERALADLAARVAALEEKTARLTALEAETSQQREELSRVAQAAAGVPRLGRAVQIGWLLHAAALLLALAALLLSAGLR
jgi:hypothetical protein